MSANMLGLAVAFAGIAVAAGIGRLVRAGRFVRESLVPALLGGVTGVFGIAALSISELFDEMALGAQVGVMAGYGLLVAGAALTANWV